MFDINNPTNINAAAFYGFHCVQCNNFVQRIPVRQNDNGPYFDTFICAFRYRAARGDERAIEIVEQMEQVIADMKGN